MFRNIGLICHAPDFIMKHYGIEKSKIDNYKSKELTERYRGFIEYYVSSSAEGQLMSAFQSLFNAMDMFSFLAGQTYGKVK